MMDWYYKGRKTTEIASRNLLNPADIVSGSSVNKYGTVISGTESTRNHVAIAVTAGHGYKMNTDEMVTLLSTPANFQCVFTTSADAPYTVVSYDETTFWKNSADPSVYVTAPDGASYMILSFVDSDMMVYDFTENGVICNRETYGSNVSAPEFFNSRVNAPKILTVGDSLTEGDYGATAAQQAQGKYTDKHNENYPYFMSKLLGLRYVTDVINLGKSGSTPITWYAANMASAVKYISEYYPDDYFVIPIMFGANGGFTDTIDDDTASGTPSTYASTAVGQYCRIIEELVALSNNRVQIVIMTTPFVDSSRSASAASNIAVANPITKKIAAKYNLPVIDVYAESGMNALTTETFQPVEGLHFNEYGYRKLGTFIGSKLASVMQFAFVG